MTDYTHLSPAGILGELDAVAADATAAFGLLDERQLNWRPALSSWSVAQCLDHLLATNREMFESMDRALDPTRPRSLLQRLPVAPALLGRLMIRSLGPTATRQFTAPPAAHPASSLIDATIVGRFVDGQRQAAGRLRALESRDLTGVIMVSPFTALVTYSVLDAWRIIVAHTRRHFAQARRVMTTPGFPAPCGNAPDRES